MEAIIKENKFAKCWVEDGILVLKFKPGVMDQECAKESVNLRLEVSEGNAYPFLSDTREVSNITKEARDYFASEIGVRQVLASALLFKSTAHKLIGNFFLKINRPTVPVKLFTTENEAKNWLKNYVK